jgi:hypothetical protein
LTALQTQFGSIWRHRVAGPVLRIVLAYVVLVEVLTQFLFGRIDVPGLHLASSSMAGTRSRFRAVCWWAAR